MKNINKSIVLLLSILMMGSGSFVKAEHAENKNTNLEPEVTTDQVESPFWDNSNLDYVSQILPIDDEDLKFSDIPQLKKGFITATPEDRKDGVVVGELGVDSGNKDMIVQLAEEIASGQYGKIDSLLIVHKGKLLLESYYLYGRVNVTHPQASATKTYTGLALGRAIQLGYLTMDDLDKPLVSFFKDLDSSKFAQGVEKITLHQALTMTTGIRVSSENKKKIRNDPKMQGQKLIQALLEQSAPITTEAQMFKYSDGPELVMQVIGAVVPGRVQDFIKNEFLNKMGITTYGWASAVNGLPKSGGHVSITSRDMVKMGTLVMNNGRWQGEQLIPEAFITRATSRINYSSADANVFGGGKDISNQGYGYFWWNADMKVGNKNYYSANSQGGGGQFIILIDELDLIVVTTGHEREVHTLQITAERILPAFIQNSNSTMNEKSDSQDKFPVLEGPYLGQKPPGLIPEIFAPRIVSTEHSELAATFSPNLKEFYFRRYDEVLKNDALVAIQYKDNLWSESFVVPTGSEFSPDGKIMHIGNEYKERTSSGWSEMKSLGAPFSDIPIMRLTTSSKGTYYFDTSPFYDKSPAVGSIRYSRLIDGVREKPRTLDIDMETRKFHPFIARDESYLIWDVQEREDGYGKLDMYISFRQKDGSWSAAINLGDKINTELSEGSGSVTSDGKYFFFTRFLDNGKKKTMWIDAGFIEALRPLQSSAQESNTDTAIDLIKKVETGLPTQVYIEGDSTWSIEERMEHYGIPGVSIAVIHNGEIAWAKGYGVMDKESQTPVTIQTLFQASALSIPVTAYGALRLVEQDKVTLDENINSYLKSWKLPENEFTKEKKVTIRNLLNHSAGIYPIFIERGGYSINEKIPTPVETLNGIFPAKNEPVTVNKEPGKSVRFAYTSYVPIQQMMLDVEGKTFPEIMHELVLQPLEMNNSTFNQSLTTELLTKAATGYLRDGSMVKGKRNIYPSMATFGLWATAEDYAKFITNIQQTLKGKSTKGLSKDLTELMGTPFGVQNSGWSATLGLGFQLQNRNNEIYLRHHGMNTGFYAEIMAHRDKGYGVVVFTNSTFPQFNAEVIRSVALTYDWDNFVPVHKKIEIEQSLIDKINGRYMSNGKIVEVFQKDNQLFYKNILDVKAEELVKVSDSSFVKRNSSRLMQFMPNSENETLNLHYINSNDGTITSTFVKMDTDKKEPVEFLLEGDFEKALNAYKIKKEHDATYPTVTEDYLNDLGDGFYHEDRMKLSQDVFKVNMMLYPDSFKVYESYAKACMKIGETDLAILNYSKSLELNPQNNNAKHMLKELKKSE